MKRILKLKLDITMIGIMLVTSIPSFSQDRVRVFDEVKSAEAIVKHINESTQLIYNEGYLQPCFILTKDVDVDAIAVCLPNEVYVKDFAIYDDTVYFCGGMWTSGTSSSDALVGWFSLAGFPSTVVRTVKNSQLKCFDKIGVYAVSNDVRELHLAMIGLDDNDNHVLIDAHKRNSVQWYFHRSLENFGLENQYVNNLIVTDNYVVFSSNTKGVFSTEGHLWCFTKPYTVGYSIFSVAAYHCSLGPTRGKVVMESLGRTEHCVNDYVVLHSGDQLNRGVHFISRFNGILHQSDYSIGSPDAGFSMDEARYSRACKTLNIGARISINPFLFSSSKVIYHLDFSAPILDGSVSGHLMTEERIFSLSSHQQSNRCDVVGQYQDIGVLKKYNFQSDDWSNCIPRVTTTCKKIDEKYNYDLIDIQSRPNVLLESFLPIVTKEFAISTICE